MMSKTWSVASFFVCFAMATLQRLHSHLMKHLSSFNESVRQLNQTILFTRGCEGMFLPIKNFEKKKNHHFSAITMDSTGEKGDVEFLSQQMFSNHNGFFLRSFMFFFSCFHLFLCSKSVARGISDYYEPFQKPGVGRLLSTRRWIP